MDKGIALKEWLAIDYFYMARRIGFIEKESFPNNELILNTIRVIDHETAMTLSPDINTIIALLALMWEHVNKEKYNLKDFIHKILSRIGYPTSAIITDNGFDAKTYQFSPTNSIFDKCTITLQQTRNEALVGDISFLLTDFQKQLWNALESQHLVGISAPTSAGKSFVILIKTVAKMLLDSFDVIYIVPTLSLLNQVTEDYNKLLSRANVKDYLITNNLSIGESKAAHTVYIWTQEKAISALSADELSGMPNKTILVVDEIQNIERISEETDVRSKILFDSLLELRHSPSIVQIIISGPRINGISDLGTSLFGTETKEIATYSSPVLSLTYSIKKQGADYFFKQYCGITSEAYEQKIENPNCIAGYGTSTVTPEYITFLCSITEKLGDDQNIIFAPTSTTARNIATSLSEKTKWSIDSKIEDLISYYSKSVNKNYSLCETLRSGVAYHHGKLPVHVRRTIETAIRQKYISNIICTTTLMQGVNLPAQNVIIRNPHLYTRHHEGEAELTSYEMANLRGRAGRLLKDFIGRTIVLDESEFEETEGYDQGTLFDDVEKEVSSGYRKRFEDYKDEILGAVSTNKLVTRDMNGYGFLVTYVRQSVLRYGKTAKQRMDETGVSLTPKQVAAIILKLKSLSVPKHICLHNRYWDPFVLDDLFLKFKGRVPSFPTERGAKNQLSEILKFLRENESTTEMYERYIPGPYRHGASRGLLCATCIKWASEKPLSELLAGEYYSGKEAAEHIENTIKLLQVTISFNIPLLIKPIIEMRNGNSAIVACLQAGAYKPYTRKMIEIGVPRELAIKLSDTLFSAQAENDKSGYEFELSVRSKIREALPGLPYWEQVQLEFLR